MSDSMDEEQGTEVGAYEEFNYIEVEKHVSTIILDFHPWVAKGQEYLSLDRHDKLEILWKKIEEDDTPIEEAEGSFFLADMAGVFDEQGDEFDCRHKTAHQFGNIGKVRWVDLQGHNYTGIFNGGSDTGFARLSSQFPVRVENEHSEFMNPSIALKFLRDGVDSANIMANATPFGQSSFNFFENSLHSLLEFDDDFNMDDRPDIQLIAKHIKPETGFFLQVGHSDFASLENDGTQIE